MSKSSSDFLVFRAKRQSDIKKALRVRWKAYRRFYPDFPCCVEKLDEGKNAIIFLAVDSDGNPVGSLRGLDAQSGCIELEDYLDVSCLIDNQEKPLVESSRLAVIKSDISIYVKLALIRAQWGYCVSRGIKTIITSAIERNIDSYKFLKFNSVGQDGFYTHPTLKAKHEVIKINVENAQQVYIDTKHPLYDFFFVDEHPNISWG